MKCMQPKSIKNANGMHSEKIKNFSCIPKVKKCSEGWLWNGIKGEILGEDMHMSDEIRIDEIPVSKKYVSFLQV